MTLTLLLSSLPAVAWAQEAEPPAGDDDAEADAQSMMTDGSSIDDQAAREFFSAGSNLYDLGRYHEAAEQFQQAYDLSHRPQLLFNVYLARRDASERRESAVALRGYLEQMPEDVDNRSALTIRLEHLEAAIAAEDAEREAAARDAETALLEEQAEAERRAARAEDDRSIAPWIVAASGGAIALVGVVTGVLALSISDGLQQDCSELPSGSYVCPDTQDLRDRQSSLSTMAAVTDILLITGGIVAAAGLTWGIIQMMSGGDDDEVAEVSAACGPTGCGASVRVGF